MRANPAKWIVNELPKIKCCNCGSTRGLVYHHIVPVICGGNEVVSNYAVVCTQCHNAIHYGNGESVIDHGALVKAGLAAAREKGIKNGKKPADYNYIIRLIAENSTQFNDIYKPDFELFTEHELMKRAGVKEVCYSKCKRMLIDAMRQEEWPFEWEKPKVCRNRPVYDGVIKQLRGY